MCNSFPYISFACWIEIVVLYNCKSSNYEVAQCWCDEIRVWCVTMQQFSWFIMRQTTMHQCIQHNLYVKKQKQHSIYSSEHVWTYLQLRQNDGQVKYSSGKKEHMLILSSEISTTEPVAQGLRESRAVKSSEARFQKHAQWAKVNTHMHTLTPKTSLGHLSHYRSKDW